MLVLSEVSRLTKAAAGIKWSSRSGSSANIFLDYVDSIFFYLPFASASEAEAAKGITPTSEWNKIRDTLAADHRAATPTTMQFSFRRGRIISPKTSSSLITAREASVTPSRRSSTGWTLPLGLRLPPAPAPAPT